MLLTYDTETTGFPVPGVPSNDPRHPKAVSISAVLDDESGVARRVMSHIIKPEGWAIDERLTGDDGKPTAFSVHGITNAMALKYGTPLNYVMAEFGEMMLRADILSAFNAHFDEKIIKISCANIGAEGEALRLLMETKSSICSMESAAGLLIGKKRISLKNAYFDLFKAEIQLGYHGSLEDAMAARRVFYEVKRSGHVMATKSLARKEYATPYEAA